MPAFPLYLEHYLMRDNCNYTAALATVTMICQHCQLQEKSVPLNFHFGSSYIWLLRKYMHGLLKKAVLQYHMLDNTYNVMIPQ